ncbi:hypothetical protein MMH89_04655 [Candidatus Comchoanobacter bicostacola]|uniref:Uncharacterized protein n=1 Tax=Candidatus Comchoanobacter bicostacola TaxID=2919598 RepID=A0ABY5DIT8_9GAMM|nr:hypothetical protein [Candidatus Comchoanobacter bicostacola]UTC24508.1 hypothetical protein MMH89_04655 [Candidatus Comchoanobacter bicostacola]
MLYEIVFLCISGYFIFALVRYKKSYPEMFSERAITKSMGTLLWLAIALLFLVLICIMLLRVM